MTDTDSRKPERVTLPGGRFVMGSNDHYAEKAPSRPVVVDAFAIDVRPAGDQQGLRRLRRGHGLAHDGRDRA